MHRGSFIAVLATLVALLGANGNAEAANRCPKHLLVPIACATVSVPLDRSGAVPGSIDLHVRRVPATLHSKGTVLALAGGPGQAANPFADVLALVLAPLLVDHDLVVFDQRGTGRSGALQCPDLQLARYRSQLAGAGAACAAQLGSSRAFYKTSDSVEDIEAVRQRLGVERLSLLGVSYGTKVAQAYAQRYPTHVERLVLDSPVLPEGPDPFARSTVAALPRVLHDLCSHAACRGITDDAVGDFRAVVERTRAAALRGEVVGHDGRRRPVSIGRAGLLDIARAGDLSPLLRWQLPAVLRAARNGDPAPLVRLAWLVRPVQVEPEHSSSLSWGLFAATTCEEGPLPWGPDAPLGGRVRRAAQTESVTDAELAPLDREGVLAASALEMCELWPGSTPQAASAAEPLPDVPALILSGKGDLRTPTEDAIRLGARMPRSRLLVLRRVGHSVLTSDLSGCSEVATARFLRGKSIGKTCRAKKRRRPTRLDRLIAEFAREIQSFFYEPFPAPPDGPLPLPPSTADALPPAHGPSERAGRAITAAELTALDAVRFDPGDFVLGLLTGKRTVIPGLRGGRYIVTAWGIRLDRVVYVPGVEVSGFWGKWANLAISGSGVPSGTLAFRPGGRVTGRLGGKRVRARPNARALRPQAPPSASAESLRSSLRGMLLDPDLSPAVLQRLARLASDRAHRS